MDNLFKVRVLTGAVNEMRTPGMVIYDRLFRGREHMEMSDRLAFDLISGSEGVLPNISVQAPATVTNKVVRSTVTLTAPRLAQKRFISMADLNALRAYGSQQAVEQMSTRVAREQQDMVNEVNRTIEYWASGALRGVIYDADGTTELVNYSVNGTHTTALTGTALWTNAASSPINRIRAYKKLIEDDSGVAITGWVAFMGSSVMDALLTHTSVLDLIKYTNGQLLAQNGRLGVLAEVELVEYNASYVDSTGTRKRFVEEDHILLVGMCSDLTDVPYAPIVDDAAGGVGNGGAGQMMFSKSWAEQDPSGRWIKVESRPVPVLQRPDCVVYAKVV